MEDPSRYEVEEAHIHNEAATNESTDVDYSHIEISFEQNQYEQSQQQQTNAADYGRPQEHQQPAEPPQVPQPSPAQPQPVQYQPQVNRPAYQPRPGGPAQFPPQGPQVNFMFQNGPNHPTPFLAQSQQAQPVQAYHVQMTQAQQVQFQQPQYQRTNAVYQNGADQPTAHPQSPQMMPGHLPPTTNMGPTVGAPPQHLAYQTNPDRASQPKAYLQGPQKISAHPSLAHNLGPPAGASAPQPGYQTAPSPVKFPPANGGAMPGSYPSGPTFQQNGAAQGIPMQNQCHAPVMMMQQIGTDGWKTGLFDCLDDPTNAVVTAFCPCITFGQVAEIVDNGNTSCATSGLLYGLVAFLIGLPCILSCTYRTKLRNRFGLVETPAPDWVTHFLCECCAICQEYRELNLRGLDPSIGWQGNVARIQGFHQQQVNMTPPMNQRMMA